MRSISRRQIPDKVSKTMRPNLLSIRTAGILLFCVPLIGGGRPAFGQLASWELMQDIRPKTYTCGFVTSAPVVDGRLDDPAWQKAVWTDDFADIEGSRKPVPQRRTRAKMVWDDENLYIAAELQEPHVWATLKQHDSVIFHDNDFEVFIDPDGDHHDYLELELNALNTTWDLYLPKPYKDGGRADNSWEFSGMRTAVHVDGTLNEPSDTDTGWSVELAIPWKSMARHAHCDCPPVEGQCWRINFSRVQWQHRIQNGNYQKVDGTREDNWVWSPQGVIDMHRPERWACVQFTRQQPGETEFSTSPDMAVRDQLMAVYHRQKTFFAAQNRWAGSLQELGVPEADAERLSMHRTSDGYQASVTNAVSGETVERWCVSQDSRLYRSPLDAEVRIAMERAGDNRDQLRAALDQSAVEQREAMEFLIANMPDRDLVSLSADYLLQNVRLAFDAMQKAAWKDSIPWDVFLNNVLPYASINERRDGWRQDFCQRFGPLIQGASTPSQAAALLNQKIFPLVKVRYSTQRPKADQSPLESIDAGLASCTGLSVLLIDACRALGVPARFVGTPLWSDKSGNHSWVEVWDNGWHFTGAAEPAGDELDKAWFSGRAATAIRDNPRHAIYAVSFQRTPLRFPLVWDRSIDYISAVNVTDRYLAMAEAPPEGTLNVMFCVRRGRGLPRESAQIRVLDESDDVVFEGTTRDERFDTNDYLQTYLPSGGEYRVVIRLNGAEQTESIRVEPRNGPWVWYVDSLDPEAEKIRQDQEETSGRSESAAAVEQLSQYLDKPVSDRPLLAEQSFADVALTKQDAADAARRLWDDHVRQIRATRAEEMQARVLTIGELKMPFDYTVFGDKPADGRSLYISMHGGGGAPSRVNDRQWENQKKLYQPDEGVYLSPRAPTDTWNLWHQEHIDPFFDRLIENLIVLEDVNPNRVYLMGYSAGGDGVYQLAPRMADRWAAAAMMAGHPNETSPLGLRNVAFTLHMGALDDAYNRNTVAAEWQQKLATLQQEDPQGYQHWVKIHDGKGHWMDREDKAAIPWMAAHRRNPLPDRIVWKQDDVVRTQFYWLEADAADLSDRAEIRADRVGNRFDVTTSAARRLTILLNDAMANLDQPVSVYQGDRLLYEGTVDRTIKDSADFLARRGDPWLVFSSRLQIELPTE